MSMQSLQQSVLSISILLNHLNLIKSNAVRFKAVIIFKELQNMRRSEMQIYFLDPTGTVDRINIEEAEQTTQIHWDL